MRRPQKKQKCAIFFAFFSKMTPNRRHGPARSKNSYHSFCEQIPDSGPHFPPKSYFLVKSIDTLTRFCATDAFFKILKFFSVFDLKAESIAQARHTPLRPIFDRNRLFLLNTLSLAPKTPEKTICAISKNPLKTPIFGPLPLGCP